MNAHNPAQPFEPLSRKRLLLWSAITIASFHLAFLVNGWFIAGFLFAAFQLAHTARGRAAFRIGMVVGWLCYGPQLPFFWTIFSFGAVALWSVLAFWLAIYLSLQRFALRKFGPLIGTFLAPVLWAGVEFFRSELYYLRFTWLTPGHALAEMPLVVTNFGGATGVGFCLMVIPVLATVTWLKWRSKRLSYCVALLGLAFLVVIGRAGRSGGSAPNKIHFAGLQIFQPHYTELLPRLDRIIQEHPETQLIVLGEYSFDGPVPEKVRDWCKQNGRFLIAGGKDEYAENKYYNTAFVIDTNGAVAFKQAKSVPIQFFNDGTPAPSQQVWESPWGKIGLGICYDMSYARVLDELIRQGAQAFIIPTMDMDDWGNHQQRLHARVARVRSAEYRISILRVCSEGISQLVNYWPSEVATVSRGEGQVLFGALTLRRQTPGLRFPVDRSLAPIAVWVSGILFGWMLLDLVNSRRQPTPASA